MTTPPRNNIQPDAPWLNLPQVALPVELEPADTNIDDVVNLPEGSALTLARIEPETGRLITTRWRNTGRLGFYPASTIKWATVALTLQLIDKHGWTLDTVIELGDDPGITLRRLMSSTIILSSNTGFCTLHELVGTRETHEAMQSWGFHDSIVRRHFKRPVYTHSREVRAHTNGQLVTTLPERPSYTAELSDDPTRPGPVAPASNRYTTDDLARMAAATLAGPDIRKTTHFHHLTNWLALTNHCYVAEGLGQVTASLPSHPPFVVLNKPGWWPGSGSVLEAGYIHDVSRQTDYVFGIYHQGTLAQAHRHTTQAFAAIFTAIHNRTLDL